MCTMYARVFDPYVYVPSTRLISGAAGADRRGEAADPALFWVSELLRLQHPGDGESSGRRRRHLLRLRRPGPGGQRGVSREGTGGREGGKESVFGCERAHVFTCMPQTKKCAQTDSCPLCHCRGQEVPLFFKIHVFLLKSHSQGVKSVYELTTWFLKTALSCLKGCLQMEVIKVLVDVIRVISANLF